MNRISKWMAVTAVGAVALAACGGGDAVPTDSEHHHDHVVPVTATAPPANTLDITAMDYAFSGHQAGHPEAIAAGRVKSFHHEQAFIRLAVDEIRGSLAGRNMLPPGSVRV